MSTAGKARRSRDGAEEAELEALQKQLATSSVPPVPATLPTSQAERQQAGPSSVPGLLRPSPASLPSAVSKQLPQLPAKASMAGPIVTEGVTDPATLALRHKEAEDLLGGRQMGAVAAAEDSDDDERTVHASVVPRLADQFVSTRPSSQSEAASKGKARAVSPHRPSTPPSKGRLYKEDASDLTTRFALLTPGSKQKLLNVLLTDQAGSGGDDSARAPEEELLVGGDDGPLANPYKSSLKQPVASVGTAPGKRGHGHSPSAAVPPKRTRQSTAQGEDHSAQATYAAGGGEGSGGGREDDVELLPHQLPFQPGTQAASFLRPHASIMGKLANSQFVALWHFTYAGVVHGHHRGQRAASLTGAFSKVMDSVAQSLEAPDAKKEDRDLDFVEASSAMDMLVECMLDVARTAPDPIRGKILEIEAHAWAEQFRKVRSHKLLHINKATWGSVFMPYLVEIRDKYYAAVPGDRFDPNELQVETLEEHVTAWRAQVRADERLDQIQARFEAAMHRPQPLPPPPPPQHAYSMHRSASAPQVSQGFSVRGRAGQGSHYTSRPFPRGPESGGRQLGACATCGTKDQPHYFGLCTAGPPGHKPFAKRGNSGEIIRISDGANISVAFAAAVITARSAAVVSGRALSPEGFERLLGEHDLLGSYDNVVAGVRDGFDFGIPPISETRIHDNHVKDGEDTTVIDDYIVKEVEKGRSLGMFTEREVLDRLGPFQTSPLGKVPKADGSWRMVQDFSYPRDGPYASVNAYIDSDEFVCGWDGFTAFLDLLWDMGDDLVAAFADAKEAFRAIWARIDQLPGLVYRTPDDKLVIDLCLPFGLSSATGVWGRVADVVRALVEAIFAKEGVRVVKWVDDFVFVREAGGALSLPDIEAALAPLCFPWHPRKRSDFSKQIRYLGFECDLDAWTVSLPEDKRAAFYTAVQPFKTSGPVSLEQTQQLLGCLQHVSMIARDMAPNLAELAASLGSFVDRPPWHRRHIDERIRNEARLWSKLLERPVIRSIRRPGPEYKLPIWVDASTEWGVGLIIGEEFAAWRLVPGWEAEQRGILWAEAAALELGVLAAIKKEADHHSVHIWSDNQGVIGSFRRGRSRGRQANLVVKRILALEQKHGLAIRVDYIRSEDNPADEPSRGLRPNKPKGSVATMHLPDLERDRAARRSATTTGASSTAATTRGSLPTLRARAPDGPAPKKAAHTPSKARLLPPPLVPKTRSKRRKNGDPKDTPLLFSKAPFPGPAPPLVTSSGLAFDPDGAWRAHASQVLQCSLEPVTVEQYSGSIRRFEDFCDAIGVADSHRYPISDDLLLAYVCSFAGRLKAGTVKNYLTGLATWHAIWGVSWVRHSSVTQALKGLDALAPKEGSLRPPILADHLLAVRSQLDLDGNPLHAAVWACALVSWWTCCRLGETTVPSPSTFSPSRHPSRASVGDPRHDPGRSFVLDVHLPWTKTTRTAGIVKSVAAVGGPLDPVVALLRHLALSPVHASIKATTHLFAYRQGDAGVCVPLDKTRMLAVFNEALLKAGKSAFSGHSFRIGGATAHWHAGASLADIKLIGGWTSNCVVRYLRDYAKGLLPVHRQTAAAVQRAAGQG